MTYSAAPHFCAGKKSFESKALADRVARLSAQRHDAKMSAYRCTDCHLWHVGSSVGGKMKSKKRCY